jgi:hypothetical protein
MLRCDQRRSRPTEADERHGRGASDQSSEQVNLYAREIEGCARARSRAAATVLASGVQQTRAPGDAHGSSWPPAAPHVVAMALGSVSGNDPNEASARMPAVAARASTCVAFAPGWLMSLDSS